jgi:hypothetical protein
MSVRPNDLEIAPLSLSLTTNSSSTAGRNASTTPPSDYNDGMTRLCSWCISLPADLTLSQNKTRPSRLKMAMAIHSQKKKNRLEFRRPDGAPLIHHAKAKYVEIGQRALVVGKLKREMSIPARLKDHQICIYMAHLSIGSPSPS